MAQATVVPAHGKMLVKIGLGMALPPDCYGRLDPRSKLAPKKSSMWEQEKLILITEESWVLFYLILDMRILWLTWEMKWPS